MSWLYTIAGLGAVSMAAVLAGARNLPGKGKMTFAGALGVAIFLIAFAASSNVFAAGAALFMLGASLVIFSISATSTLQVITPKEMQGRVMSVNQIAWQGLEYLGVLFTGALAAALSAPPVLIAAGLIVAAVTITIAYLRPQTLLTE